MESMQCNVVAKETEPFSQNYLHKFVLYYHCGSLLVEVSRSKAKMRGRRETIILKILKSFKKF